MKNSRLLAESTAVLVLLCSAAVYAQSDNEALITLSTPAPASSPSAILQTIANDMRQSWPTLVNTQGWPPVGTPISYMRPPRGMIIGPGRSFDGFYLPNVPLNGTFPASICQSLARTLKFVNNTLQGTLPSCVYNMSTIETFWFERELVFIMDFPNTTAAGTNPAMSPAVFFLDTVNAGYYLDFIDMKSLTELHIVNVPQFYYLTNYNFSFMTSLEILNIQDNIQFQMLGSGLQFPNSSSQFTQCVYANNAPFSDMISCEVAELIIPSWCGGGNTESCLALNSSCRAVVFWDEVDEMPVIGDFCQHGNLTGNLTLQCVSIGVTDSDGGFMNTSVCNMTVALMSDIECYQFCSDGGCSEAACLRSYQNASAEGYAIINVTCLQYQPYDIYNNPIDLMQCNLTFGMGMNPNITAAIPPNTSVCYNFEAFDTTSGNQANLLLCPSEVHVDGWSPSGTDIITGTIGLMTTFGTATLGILGCMHVSTATPQMPSTSSCGCSQSCATDCADIIEGILGALSVIVTIAIAVATLGAAAPEAVIGDAAEFGADASSSALVTSLANLLAEGTLTAFDEAVTAIQNYVVEQVTILLYSVYFTASEIASMDAETLISTAMDWLIQQGLKNFQVVGDGVLSFVVDGAEGTDVTYWLEFADSALSIAGESWSIIKEGNTTLAELNPAWAILPPISPSVSDLVTAGGVLTKIVGTVT